jgi:CPA1 family monovalent cation:H+ antiporter
MRTNLNKLWVLIDEILTTALFVFMGLLLIIIPFHTSFIVAGIIMSAVVLGARYVSVKYTMIGLEKHNLQTFSSGSLPVLVWGGMRGAISFAMAMMLPAGPAREALIAITFIVVVISVIAQGLTMEKVINWSGVRSSE